MGNVRTLLLSFVLEWEVMHFPNFKGRLHMLLAVFCVCRLYQPDVFSDISGNRTVPLSSCVLPGNKYKPVSHIWTIFRISRTIFFWILIYSDSHLFWLLYVLICYYVYHYVHSMCCILCVCINVIT